MKSSSGIGRRIETPRARSYASSVSSPCGSDRLEPLQGDRSHIPVGMFCRQKELGSAKSRASGLSGGEAAPAPKYDRPANARLRSVRLTQVLTARQRVPLLD